MAFSTVGVAVGDRYGKLTVVSDSWLGPERNGRRKRKVLVRCECGVEYAVNAYALETLRSCRRCVVPKLKHGQASSPIYRSWYNMKTRSSPDYTVGRYGDVSRDPRWDSFAEFFADMGDSWFPGAVLSRIGDEGDYCKDNCRWITRAENGREGTATRVRLRRQRGL